MDTEVICIECGRRSPPQMGEMTLMSRTGWRIVRAKLPDGSHAVEWRCPDCWARYKLRKGGSTFPSMADPRRKP